MIWGFKTQSLKICLPQHMASYKQDRWNSKLNMLNQFQVTFKYTCTKDSCMCPPTRVAFSGAFQTEHDLLTLQHLQTC